MTKIQWANKTWNPIVGCSRISEGCKNCYAAESAKSARLQQFPQYQKVKKWDGTLEFVESQLLKPLSWQLPIDIFVCSMSDLYHENAKEEWQDKVLAVMVLTSQHTYQILTKRPDLMLQYFSDPDREAKITEQVHKIAELLSCNSVVSKTLRQKPIHVQLPLPNVILGTSVENQKAADERIPILCQIPAAVRFLSCEPLLESVDLSKWLPLEWSEVAEDWIEAWPGAKCYQQKLHWVIIGGESGASTKARECHTDWLRSLANQCQRGGVPVFVKQLGSNLVGSFLDPYYLDPVPKTDDRIKLKDRKGGDINEFPEGLRIRQFPQ